MILDLDQFSSLDITQNFWTNSDFLHFGRVSNILQNLDFLSFVHIKTIFQVLLGSGADPSADPTAAQCLLTCFIMTQAESYVHMKIQTFSDMIK